MVVTMVEKKAAQLAQLLVVNWAVTTVYMMVALMAELLDEMMAVKMVENLGLSTAVSMAVTKADYSAARTALLKVVTTVGWRAE